MPSATDPRIRLLVELSDPTRFGILEQLERAPASATELARTLDVSPTQLANHLRRLRNAELVAVKRHGRLAIYTLTEPGLREIFSMLNGLRGTPAETSQPVPEAATCYDHLAGRLGVALLDYLIDKSALEARSGEGSLTLGPRVDEVFAALGVTNIHQHGRRLPAYACLDTNIGRPHLGGHLGAALAGSLHQQGWVTPTPSARQLALTHDGRQQLKRLGALA